MSDGLLTFEHGKIALDDVDVPGILKSQVIRGAVRFDTADPDGHSGTVRTPMGWEDSDIVLEVVLLPEEQITPFTGSESVYEKLARINSIFKGSDNGGNPKVYDVDNAHVNARGIDKVVFSGMQSIEKEEDDTLEVHMNFVEHLPFEEKKDTQVSASDKAFETDTSTQTPEHDEKIFVDVS